MDFLGMEDGKGLTDEIGHATLTDIKFVKEVTILYLVQTLKQNRMFTL
jgi:hypothetical protein